MLMVIALVFILLFFPYSNDDPDNKLLVFEVFTSTTLISVICVLSSEELLVGVLRDLYKDWETPAT